MTFKVPINGEGEEQPFLSEEMMETIRKSLALRDQAMEPNPFKRWVKEVWKAIRGQKTVVIVGIQRSDLTGKMTPFDMLKEQMEKMLETNKPKRKVNLSKFEKAIKIDPWKENAID